MRKLVIYEEYGVFHVIDSQGREGSGGNISTAATKLVVEQGTNVVSLNETKAVQDFFERVCPAT